MAELDSSTMLHLYRMLCRKSSALELSACSLGSIFALQLGKDGNYICTRPLWVEKGSPIPCLTSIKTSVEPSKFKSLASLEKKIAVTSAVLEAARSGDILIGNARGTVDCVLKKSSSIEQTVIEDDLAADGREDECDECCN